MANVKCNFTDIKIVESTKESYACYTWSFRYKGKFYSSTLIEPITDIRIINSISFMLKIMRKLAIEGVW